MTDVSDQEPPFHDPRSGSPLHDKTHRQPRYIQESCRVEPEPERQTSPTTGKKWICIGLILCLIGIVAAFIVPKTFGSRDITTLKKYFKSQDPKMWKMLQAALLPTKTELVRTYVFLHNSKTTTECLINWLSHKECTEYKAREISLRENFLSDVKEKLEKEKCMVILDLEEMSPDGVMVLKGLCDAYTPVVKNAEFYFTLNSGDKLNSRDEAQLVREILEPQWAKHLTYDEFSGTMTRLCQNLVKVFKEDTLPHCNPSWNLLNWTS